MIGAGFDKDQQHQYYRYYKVTYVIPQFSVEGTLFSGKLLTILPTCQSKLTVASKFCKITWGNHQQNRLSGDGRRAPIFPTKDICRLAIGVMFIKILPWKLLWKFYGPIRSVYHIFWVREARKNMKAKLIVNAPVLPVCNSPEMEFESVSVNIVFNHHFTKQPEKKSRKSAWSYGQIWVLWHQLNPSRDE